MSLREVLEASSTFQEIVANVLRETILSMATERFGKPERPEHKKLEAIGDPAVLRPMAVRLLHVSSWKELLDETAGYEAAKADGMRRLLLKQGERRFGDPPLSVLERLDRMHNAEPLLPLGTKLFGASSWEQLLDGE